MNFFKRLFPKRSRFYLGFEIRSELPIKGITVTTEAQGEPPAPIQQTLPMYERLTDHATNGNLERNV